MAFDYQRFLKGYHDLCKQTGSHPEDGISAYAAANYVASKRKQAAWAEHREWWKNGQQWDKPGESHGLHFSTKELREDYNEDHAEMPNWWVNQDYWYNQGGIISTRWRPTEDAAIESIWRQTRWQDRKIDAETIEEAIEDWGAEVIIHILRTELRSLIELDRAIGRPNAWVMIDRRGKQIPVKNPEWVDWQRRVEA